jgi:hypothetical protein
MSDYDSGKATRVEQASTYYEQLKLTNMDTYRSWRAMHARCYNTRHLLYEYYGARGIEVCKRWFDFEIFLADMGPRPHAHSLDLIDFTRDYEPGNCRWTTQVKRKQRLRWSRPIVEPVKPLKQLLRESVALARKGRKNKSKSAIISAPNHTAGVSTRKVEISPGHWQYIAD